MLWFRLSVRSLPLPDSPPINTRLNRWIYEEAATEESNSVDLGEAVVDSWMCAMPCRHYFQVRSSHTGLDREDWSRAPCEPYARTGTRPTPHVRGELAILRR